VCYSVECRINYNFCKKPLLHVRYHRICWKTVDGERQKISSDWQELPDDLEAATLLKENRALFIKGSRCYITYVVSKTVLDNQDCTSMFYNC
jgi:hypothetical protein